MKNLFKIYTTSTITEEHFEQYLVVAKTKEEAKLKLGKYLILDNRKYESILDKDIFDLSNPEEWLNDIHLIDELT